MEAKAFAKPKDWRVHRPTITRLYLTENRPLREVISRMSKDYNFNATPKMYKTHFRSWGVHKNVQAYHAAVILRMTTERKAAGKSSKFRLNGRVISMKRVMSYAQRKKKTTILDPAPLEHSSFPGDEIECFSPESSTDPGEPEDQTNSDEYSSPVTISCLEIMNPVEVLLGTVQNYILGSFESRIWTPELMKIWQPVDLGGVNHVVRNHRTPAFEIYTLVRQSRGFLMNGAMPLYGARLRKGFDLIHEAISDETAFTLWELLNTVAYLAESGWEDILTSFLIHVKEMASIKRGSYRHPLSVIFSYFLQLSRDELLQTIAVMRECAAEYIERSTGRSSVSSLLFRLGWLRAVSVLQNAHFVEEQLRSRLEKCRSEHGYGDPRCLLILNRLGGLLLENGWFAEAELVANEMLASLMVAERDLISRGRALSTLARSQAGQGKWASAEKSAHILVEHNRRHFGSEDSLTVESLVLLENALLANGRIRQAETIVHQICYVTS